MVDEGQPEPEFQRILDIVDPNRDGYVTLQEYMAFMISKETENIQSSEEIESAFRALSKEFRPYVTAEELYAVSSYPLSFDIASFSLLNGGNHRLRALSSSSFNMVAAGITEGLQCFKSKVVAVTSKKHPTIFSQEFQNPARSFVCTAMLCNNKTRFCRHLEEPAFNLNHFLSELNS